MSNRVKYTVNLSNCPRGYHAALRRELTGVTYWVGLALDGERWIRIALYIMYAKRLD